MKRRIVSMFTRFPVPPTRKRAEHSPLGTPVQPAACARLVAKRAETMLAVLGAVGLGLPEKSEPPSQRNQRPQLCRLCAVASFPLLCVLPGVVVAVALAGGRSSSTTV